MDIMVVLRTCSNSLLSRSDTSRICGNDRELLLRKCFFSLTRTILNSSHNISLTVLDDNSDEKFIEFIKSFSAEIKTEIIRLSNRGPNYSAEQQFKTAAESNCLVYMVEDDYLHEENAIDYMVGAYLNFVKRYNKDTVIYPHDCSLRYTAGNESSTTLYHDGVRYWRDVDKTANTMLVHPLTIKSNWDVFKNLAKNYPKVLEDDTINKLYYNEENRNASIRAFSPIPSVAYHVGYSNPTSIATTHMNWQDLWNRIEKWDLIQGWFYNPEYYLHLVNSLHSGSTIVEIGAWRGKSTCCLAEMIKRSKKDIKLYSVDTWEGSDEKEHTNIINTLQTTLFDDFLSNLKFCDVEKLVKPIKMSSVLASLQFDDASIDAVIIDGAHDYDSVKLDLVSWEQKIKPGGIITGDDYSESWPGVIKAVNERYGSRVNTYKAFWYVNL